MKKLFKQFVEKQLRYSPLFYKRLKAVQEVEKLDKDKVNALQQEKFLLLLRKAYKESPFYRSLYRKHGVDIDKIKSVHDIQLCPIITREEVVEHYPRIFSGCKLNRIKAQSSGTSGQSITVYRDYRSVIEEGAYQWAHRISFGHHPGMKTVVIRGNLHLQEKERYDPFTKTLYLSSFRLNRENAAWYFKRIKDFAPNAIFAYPSSVESLANFFIERDQRLRVPLIFTSSETLYRHQREKIEDVFRSRIIDWYGNTERTIALKERSDGLYDQIPLYSINEFRDDCVITTSLINFSFPLIRYQVDDVMLCCDEPNLVEGRRKIKQIQGRSDDVLILPDGTRIGLIIAFDGIEHLLFSQIVQERRDTIQVNLVVTETYSRAEETLLRKQLKENIGETVSIVLNYVSKDKIIKSESGKFKLIVNRLETDTQRLSV